MLKLEERDVNIGDYADSIANINDQGGVIVSGKYSACAQ